MKRIITLGLVAAFIAMGPGLALSKAVKMELAPYPATSPIEPGASGHAILNYAKGADGTEIQVNCWGLTPDTTYTVYLKPAAYLAIGTFTTKKNGSGNFHIRLDGDQSVTLAVAVNNPGGSTVLHSKVKLSNKKY